MMFFALALVALVVGFFSMGYVTSQLWNWFIAPLGTKKISFWHGFGISLFVSSFNVTRANLQQQAQLSFDDGVKLVVQLTAAALGLLLFGWLAKSQMEKKKSGVPTDLPTDL